MPDPIDTCTWTIIKITVGTIRDRLAAAGFQPSLANVERVMAVVGPQPSIDGLQAQRNTMISTLIMLAADLDQRAKEIDDAE